MQLVKQLMTTVYDDSASPGDKRIDFQKCARPNTIQIVGLRISRTARTGTPDTYVSEHSSWQRTVSTSTELIPWTRTKRVHPDLICLAVFIISHNTSQIARSSRSGLRRNIKSQRAHVYFHSYGYPMNPNDNMIHFTTST